MDLQTCYLMSGYSQLTGNQYVVENVASDDELNAYRRGIRSPVPNLKLTLKGRKKVDIMYGADNFYVSERVVDVLKAKGFTGWKLFPIDIESSKPIPVKFHGLQFCGSAGRSLGGFKAGIGNIINFDPAAWDGSDFFMLDVVMLTFITPRVYAAFTEAGFTGPDFKEIVPKLQ